MAEAQDVSKSTVNNIWQGHNLKPHRVKTFKLSRDAKFLEKLNTGESGCIRAMAGSPPPRGLARTSTHCWALTTPQISFDWPTWIVTRVTFEA
jgi:hypothetical protein